MPTLTADHTKALKRELLQVLERHNTNGPDGCHALANALLDGATALLQDPRENVNTAASCRMVAQYLNELADAPIHRVSQVRQSFNRLVM